MTQSKDKDGATNEGAKQPQSSTEDTEKDGSQATIQASAAKFGTTSGEGVIPQAVIKAEAGPGGTITAHVSSAD